MFDASCWLIVVVVYIILRPLQLITIPDIAAGITISVYYESVEIEHNETESEQKCFFFSFALTVSGIGK